MNKPLRPSMPDQTDRRTFLRQTTAAGLGAAALVAGGRDAAQARVADAPAASPARVSGAGRIGFVIHGGAGVLPRAELTPHRDAEYRQALNLALAAGYAILSRDGSALDAVEAAIRLLEDSPLFNAGKGAVFTSAGTNELDASVMDGRTLKAGAVSTLKHIKNPITLARLVMERSPHVMLVGDGAEAFARTQGIGMVPQSYFYTERRYRDWQRAVAEEKQKQSPSVPPPAGNNKKRTAHGAASVSSSIDKHGTVGAVALDRAGNLAAGTSTGGTTNKQFGRVGDSPIIGAGTYADNRTCAVSATGDGEYFIRAVVAHDLSALVEYRQMPVAEAARLVLDKVKRLGGEGGVIAIDRDGHLAQAFNSEGMYRGHADADGKLSIEIY